MNDVIKRFRKQFTYDDSIRDIEDDEIIDVKYINPGVTSEDIEHFIQLEIRKAKEEQRERIKEIVSIEIEAWFGAHDEMEKSFMSEDMIKQIVKRMEEV